MKGAVGYGMETPALHWTTALYRLMTTFQGTMTSGTSAYEDRGSTILRLPSKQSNIVAAFNASSNISMTMNNIATALKNHIRDSSNITVIGQVGQTQIFVHVVWPWIILPALLVISGIFFLILVMLKTKKHKACIWKTSELSLLFLGLKNIDHELHAFRKLSEMEQAASEIRIKMTETSNDGWILLGEKEE